MVKKSILVRENKRQNTVKKYSLERKNILLNLKKAKSLEEKFNLNEELQKLPRNSSNTRLKNRCWKTGKSRGFFRFFGLCRNAFREFAHNCYLPGVTKASW
uniref:Small ribosomal subunit protein uS14c n=1 Tax=Pedospumella sp. Jangsampo120217C5 TaxID=2782409 RepID=A0A7S6PUY0_9STRA|nr:ribosomal protein S14 [Pedospumella sp. Jangsampo120217C5]